LFMFLLQIHETYRACEEEAERAESDKMSNFIEVFISQVTEETNNQPVI